MFGSVLVGACSQAVWLNKVIKSEVCFAVDSLRLFPACTMIELGKRLGGVAVTIPSSERESQKKSCDRRCCCAGCRQRQTRLKGRILELTVILILLIGICIFFQFASA